MTRRFAQKWNWVALVVVLVMLALMTGCAKSKRETESIQLRLGEDVLVTVEDPESLKEIKYLLSGAQDIGFVPKTYLLGPSLVYTAEDGQQTVLELDLDGDLFRYDGRFFDYGPGNDNNALHRLLVLLELSDWPEEVKAAYPEWFAAVDSFVTAPEAVEEGPPVYMDLWYPDWRWLEIRGPWKQGILDAIQAAGPEASDQTMPAVEETRFTLHIAYDEGREYDLVCVETGVFLLRDFGTNVVYSIRSDALQEALDQAIMGSETE